MATSPGKGARPTVVITTDFKIFLGNEKPETLMVEAFPIFGFGLGEFEDKVIAGGGFNNAHFVDYLATQHV